ncbi:hypothetical protein [Variovorax rhizosphaerae]|uniref:Uncharacterized protein n=1 Tax=Variovorax rhizosphaerae TaxID=1836200 RepID=A0ABU8WFT8_9BURK
MAAQIITIAELEYLASLARLNVVKEPSAYLVKRGQQVLYRSADPADVHGWLAAWVAHVR